MTIKQWAGRMAGEVRRQDIQTGDPLNPPPNKGLFPEWHLTETYKGLITLSIEALKMLVLVNGGAAVAVLTYLGNLAARYSTPTPKLPAIKPALLCYCGGVVLAMLAFIAAHLAQLKLYDEQIGIGGGVRMSGRYAIYVVVGSMLTFFAAVLFGAGCWNAVDALTR